MADPQTAAPRHIFWDCDGTLVDSEILAMAVAARALIRQFSLDEGAHPSSESELIAEWAGLSFSQMIDRCEVGREPLSEEVRRRLIAENVVETLAALGSVRGNDGIATALRADYVHSVVTSSGLERVSQCLESVDIMEAFAQADGSHRIFSAESLGCTPKPDPAVYLHALAELGAVAGDVVAVEDSISGVRAAAAAEIGTIVGFVGGSHIPDSQKGHHAAALRAAGATLVVRDGVELMTALVGLEAGLEATNVVAPSSDRSAVVL